MEASSGRCFPGQDASRRRDSLEGEEGLTGRRGPLSLVTDMWYMARL